MNLADLIRRTKGDRSYARLSQDCGGSPTAARLQQIATTKRMTDFPDVPTIRALSRGLGVPIRTVVLAAAESVGLDVQADSPIGDLLPTAASSFTDRQIAALVAVTNAMNDRVDHAPGSGKTASFLAAQTSNAAAGAPAQDDYALAARPGVPANMPDTTTGEESQDPGNDEPA